jgi:hypothetical protein
LRFLPPRLRGESRNVGEAERLFDASDLRSEIAEQQRRAAESAADPHGFFGTIKEGMASARALAEAKASGGGDELIKAVVDDLLTSDGRANAREGVKALIQGAKLSEIKDRALTDLGRTAAILDAKAPADAKAFKAWLAHIAQLVAEAASEGGFLGFGGVKVSDTEKATLAEISKALGA